MREIKLQLPLLSASHAIPFPAAKKQELSCRTQIARQMRRQYVAGIYTTGLNITTICLMMYSSHEAGLVQYG